MPTHCGPEGPRPGAGQDAGVEARRTCCAAFGAVLALLLSVLGPACAERQQNLRTGLEVLESTGFAALRGKRVGVVTNPTGVDSSLRPLQDMLANAPGVRLVAIFGPEHGAQGATVAGAMVEHSRDPRSGVPVYSLYGDVRRPSKEMLSGIDVLLFDIQDVGTRAYTYLSTLGEILAAVGPDGPEVWVLDRPVPIGGDIVEGPVLEAGHESFVGFHTVALRHGLTAGEFARMVNDERFLGAKLRVVPMEGYRRDMSHDRTGLVWIPPSPNIPTVETALLYAGMVLVEGTNLSEGRGTTRPFHLLGAPWMDGDSVAAFLASQKLPGCLFRSVRFVPEASKYAGQECSGVEIHITDPRAVRAVVTTVTMLQAVLAVHPKEFRFHAETFDRLAGSPALRTALENRVPPGTIVRSWEEGLAGYLQRRERFLLYR